MESEVLHNLVVPQVSLVQVLLSELIRVILARLELKLDLILSLQIAGNVSVITVIKTLLLKNLFDSKDVFLDVCGHFT